MKKNKKPESYWNYRIFVKRLLGGSLEFNVREMYYEDGKPFAYCEASLGGDTPREIFEELKMIKKDIKKAPIYWEDEKFPENFQPKVFQIESPSYIDLLINKIFKRRKDCDRVCHICSHSTCKFNIEIR